jgi:hypothetical protein
MSRRRDARQFSRGECCARLSQFGEDHHILLGARAVNMQAYSKKERHLWSMENLST